MKYADEIFGWVTWDQIIIEYKAVMNCREKTEFFSVRHSSKTQFVPSPLFLLSHAFRVLVVNSHYTSLIFHFCSSCLSRRGWDLVSGNLPMQDDTICPDRQTVPLLLLRLWQRLLTPFNVTDCTSVHAYSAGQVQGTGPGDAELRSESVRTGGWMGDSGAEQGLGERVQGCVCLCIRKTLQNTSELFNCPTSNISCKLWNWSDIFSGKPQCFPEPNQTAGIWWRSCCCFAVKCHVVLRVIDLFGCLGRGCSEQCWVEMKWLNDGFNLYVYIRICWFIGSKQLHVGGFQPTGAG